MLDKAAKDGFEGLMLKSLEAAYSQTRTHWAKLKKFIIKRGKINYWIVFSINILKLGMADSLDLIPMAAYFGKGRRSNGYGAYLLGASNPST
jgi:DNA ligase-1